MSSQDDKNTYKYFVLGNVTPVRVTIDAKGLPMNAEAPDPQTGKLAIRTTLLSRLAASPEVEEVNAAVFHDMCASASLKKKTPKPRLRLG